MKVLAAFFKYDYGDPRKGLSNEHLVWVPQLHKTGHQIDVFYLEEHGYPDRTDELQKELLAYVAETRPDIVFFMFMKDEIRNETLQQLATMTKTVNWFCDDQWRFETYTKYKAPYLTLCLTVDKFCVEKYRLAGLENVRLVSWGPSHEMPLECPSTQSFEFDVSFVGQRNETRDWFIEELAKRGVRVDTFGPGWPNGKVSHERMKEIFLKSRINLNLSNSVPNDFNYVVRHHKFQAAVLRARILSMSPKQVIMSLVKWVAFVLKGPRPVNEAKNREQIKARYFEIPACGGFQIGRMVQGLDDYLCIGKEIVVYSTIDEAADAIQYFLSREDARSVITQASYMRVRDYQYSTQLATVFADLGREAVKS